MKSTKTHIFFLVFGGAVIVASNALATGNEKTRCASDAPFNDSELRSYSDDDESDVDPGIAAE